MKYMYIKIIWNQWHVATDFRMYPICLITSVNYHDDLILINHKFWVNWVLTCSNYSNHWWNDKHEHSAKVTVLKENNFNELKLLLNNFKILKLNSDEEIHLRIFAKNANMHPYSILPVCGENSRQRSPHRAATNCAWVVGLRQPTITC